MVQAKDINVYDVHNENFLDLNIDDQDKVNSDAPAEIVHDEALIGQSIIGHSKGDNIIPRKAFHHLTTIQELNIILKE